MERGNRAQTAGNAIGRILKVASAPLVIGWVSAWVAPFLGTPLGHIKWEAESVDLVRIVGAILTVVLIGIFKEKPRDTIRGWAIGATAGFILGIVACFVLDFLVGRVLDTKDAVLIVRDDVWRLVYIATLVLAVSTLVLWCLYLWRHRIDPALPAPPRPADKAPGR